MYLDEGNWTYKHFFIDREEDPFQYEINFPVMKKNLGSIIAKCIDKHGLNISAELLDYIKATGFKYSTKGAVTVSVADVAVPEAKKEILEINVSEEKIEILNAEQDEDFEATKYLPINFSKKYSGISNIFLVLSDASDATTTIRAFFSLTAFSVTSKASALTKSNTLISQASINNTLGKFLDAKITF